MTTGSPVRIRVRAAGDRDYTVWVAPGLVDRVGAHAVESAPEVARWAVVGDDTVLGLYGRRVQASLEAERAGVSVLGFPAGERHKTRDVWADLTDRLVADGFGRDGGIVALGGGVSGDLAGFVAATYMRGIPVLQVPTSIVAMVDSAVGGKTGVDTRDGKNLVGAFHPPVGVVIDPAVVATLPREHRAGGLAEAVKHGAIVDADYARRLAEEGGALLNGRVDAVQRMVVRSVEVKSGVVSRDERESGLREILNFGHTVGHALEAASGFELSHGEAVAIGMVVESRLGEALGRTEVGTARTLGRILEAVELPTRPPPGVSPERVLSFLRADKKVRGGEVRAVFLESLGAVWREGGRWAHPVEEDRLRRFLASA